MSSVEEHRSRAPASVGFGVLTVSDTRTLENDPSGDLICRLVLEEGHRPMERRLVRDEAEEVRDAVVDLLERESVDLVVVTGGTGLAFRDVTIEAVEPLFDRPVPGFGELFRWLSYQEVGPAAMLSRAVAGICGRKAVFALPGSPKAVALAMSKLVLPEAGHLLGQLRS